MKINKVCYVAVIDGSLCGDRNHQIINGDYDYVQGVVNSDYPNVNGVITQRDKTTLLIEIKKVKLIEVQ